jgi:hypothetical protein
VWPAVLAITLVLGWIDWATGHELNFFVFYFLPVGLAGWYLGLNASVFMAVTCALVWFGADVTSGRTYSSHFYAVWNTTIRLCSFLAIGWSVQKIHALLIAERQKSDALRRSLSEIRVLRGLLPICAHCKRIRDAEGTWQHLEAYIGEHSDVRFSHGFCPECGRKVLEEAGITGRTSKSEVGGHRR